MSLPGPAQVEAVAERLRRSPTGLGGPGDPGDPGAGRPSSEPSREGADLARVYRGLVDELLADPPATPTDVAAAQSDLGRLHEEVLAAREGPRPDVSRRRAAGAYFTPLRLVEAMLDEALEPVLAAAAAPADVLALRVVDPACGAGFFLAAVVRRLRRRLAELDPQRTVEPATLLRCVSGVDLDAAVLELARGVVLLEVGGSGPVDLRAGDALLGAPVEVSSPPAADAWAAERLPAAAGGWFHWGVEFAEVFGGAGGFDLVVGNPPFLSRLSRRTAPDPAYAAFLGEAAVGSLGAYTDIAAVFLDRATTWVRPGGRVALVQPVSVLAARDTAGVRAAVARSCDLEWLWASDRPVFDASVLTCAVVARRRPDPPDGAPASRARGVRRAGGPDLRPLPDHVPGPGGPGAAWAPMLAAALGVPEVSLRGDGVLGDLGAATADFRDQYYLLQPYVGEAADLSARGVRWAPLVTTGLVEPAQLLWGERDTRFAKRRWVAPAVDLDAAEADPRLAGWLRRRLVPKVVVGTQGRVVEAVVDERGRWVPSVPTVSVTVEEDRLWHALAVLCAPPVAAHAAAAYAGTAMSLTAVKLSARQVAALPLPRDRDRWDLGAELARRVHGLDGGDGSSRAALFADLGAAMCGAYGLATSEGRAVTRWWLSRAGLGPARPGR